MKHISNLSQATALVAALGAACLTSLSAQAQSNTPNAGNLKITAAVSKATCAVTINDPNSTTNKSAYKALNLGNIAGTNASGVAGQTFGTAKSISFALKDPSNLANPCSLTGISNWELHTTLKSTDFVTISGKTFLKNQILPAEGGTNAVVALTTGGKPITLAAGDTTLFTRAKTNTDGGLAAQFAFADTKAASAGKYNFNMPVTIIYK